MYEAPRSNVITLSKSKTNRTLSFVQFIHSSMVSLKNEHFCEETKFCLLKLVFKLETET